MPFLSPAKLIVILVVALIVLGPDKLPGMARQVGSLWAQFRTFRQRFEDDVRGNFPDLPSTDVITQAVRSPISFLDQLADAHSADNDAARPTEGAVPGPTGAAVRPAGTTNRPSGTVEASEASTVPGTVMSDPQGTVQQGAHGHEASQRTTVHRVRSGGPLAPDDPSSN